MLIMSCAGLLSRPMVKCVSRDCSGRATCYPGEVLERVPGECCPKCVFKNPTCTVATNPKITTFDGYAYNFQVCVLCCVLSAVCFVLGARCLVFGVWCLVFSVLCWGSIKHGLRPWSSALPIWTIQSVLTLSLCHVSLAVSGLEFSDYCFVFYDLFLCFVFSV